MDSCDWSNSDAVTGAWLRALENGVAFTSHVSRPSRGALAPGLIFAADFKESNWRLNTAFVDAIEVLNAQALAACLERASGDEVRLHREEWERKDG